RYVSASRTVQTVRTVRPIRDQGLRAPIPRTSGSLPRGPAVGTASADRRRPSESLSLSRACPSSSPARRSASGLRPAASSDPACQGTRRGQWFDGAQHTNGCALFELFIARGPVWNGTHLGRSLSKSRSRNRRALIGGGASVEPPGDAPVRAQEACRGPQGMTSWVYGSGVFATKSLAPFAKHIHARRRIAQPLG